VSGRPSLPVWLRDRWRRLKLASKLNLTLVAVGAIGLILAGLALDRTIRPAFDGLERAGVEQQVAQAQALLQSSLGSIESTTKDYAVWDDSYDYVATPNPAFEGETLTTLALVNLGVNAMAYVRFNGQVLHSRYVDLESETDAPALSAAFATVSASDRIRAMARSQTSFADFVQLDGRILAIGVAQVVHSDGTGAPAGYVVMAVEFGGATASEALQTASVVTREIAPASMVSTRDAWRVVVPVASPAGASVGSLTFEAPRDTSKLGATTIASALLTSALVMAGTLLAVFLIMRVFVVKRLAGIDGHMRKVAKDGLLLPLQDDPSRDEVGALSRSFNTMLVELKDLREQLEAQSFQLGKSESAAGAMHNVRNSLNPVTVIVSQAIAEQASANAQHIAQAIRELSCGDTVQVRRERLAAFLVATFDEVDRRAAARRESFMTAKASLAEALEILRSQNDAAHQEIPLERFDILDVVKKAASLARFAPWGEIELHLPQQGMIVRANRLLTSQVIGNLLTNAVEAIVAADRRPGRLSISFARADTAGANGAKITVTDDGVGFPPEMAAKLFERGHSSKKACAGGLGLHWCANTVKAMGGALSLESDGPGKGARAIIVLQGLEFVESVAPKAGVLAA
jgi:signal transduction histidine kinase